MSEFRFSLCPNCDSCPEVVIGDDVIVIGEEGNQVRLSPEEWSVLVSGIKRGVLVETRADPASCGCGCDCC